MYKSSKIIISKINSGYQTWKYYCKKWCIVTLDRCRSVSKRLLFSIGRLPADASCGFQSVSVAFSTRCLFVLRKCSLTAERWMDRGVFLLKVPALRRSACRRDWTPRNQQLLVDSWRQEIWELSNREFIRAESSEVGPPLPPPLQQTTVKTENQARKINVPLFRKCWRCPPTHAAEYLH